MQWKWAVTVHHDEVAWEEYCSNLCQLLLMLNGLFCWRMENCPISNCIMISRPPNFDKFRRSFSAGFGGIIQRKFGIVKKHIPPNWSRSQWNSNWYNVSPFSAWLSSCRATWVWCDICTRTRPPKGKWGIQKSDLCRLQFSCSSSVLLQFEFQLHLQCCSLSANTKSSTKLISKSEYINCWCELTNKEFKKWKWNNRSGNRSRVCQTGFGAGNFESGK